MNMEQNTVKEKVFTPYQIFVIAILAFIQFTVVLDFMVLNPLGVFLIDDLKLTPSQFSNVVSAYAFSAGIAGILAAGFADRFDRKKMMMVYYAGFLIGTVFCAIAPTYHLMLGARIVAGIFGGLVGGTSIAIITDLFKPEVRGRVMGFVQMAFAVSQVLGLPLGLYLAKHYHWHSSFWMISIVGFLVGIVMLVKLKPIDGHLAIKSDRNPFAHLAKTAANPAYLRAFLTTTLLATGGFMLMPFGSTFTVNNMKCSQDDLIVIYTATGVASLLFGPLIGRLSDKLGKFSMFAVGSVVAMAMVGIFTNLGPTPLYMAVIVNILLFLGITTRMISSSALITAIPKPADRGAFMSINSSTQYLAGGIAATIAGQIVTQQTPDSEVENYGTLGIVVIVSMIAVLGFMYMLHLHLKKTAPAAALKTS
jgi:predicted MFS family arabinose efflux permease